MKRLSRVGDAVETHGSKQHEVLRGGEERADGTGRDDHARILAQLAGGIAHRFNNLLTAVLGNAELALRPGTSLLETEERLRTIAVAAREMAATVERVQQFAGDAVGGERAPVDLARVAQEALAVTEAAGEQGAMGPGPDRIWWEATLRPVPAIEGDGGELRRALVYLIENAIEAMPTGGRLHVETGADRASVWVRVRDSGVGIAPALRGRIYEPFFTTRPVQKRGLGLSVAHRTVIRHGGSVELESEEGLGSAFTLTFPRRAIDP